MIVHLLAGALLVAAAACADTSDLEQGGYGPPTPRRPHETTPTECDQLGWQWIPNAAVEAGGYCQRAKPPPLAIHLCQFDAAALTFCHLDAGADAGDAGVDGALVSGGAERCDHCGRRHESVALCTCCYRRSCDRKKCRGQHDACYTDDELADPI